MTLEKEWLVEIFNLDLQSQPLKKKGGELYNMEDKKDREQGEKLFESLTKIMDDKERENFGQKVEQEHVSLLESGINSYALAVQIAANNQIFEWDKKSLAAAFCI
ncbi:MAG: hypothetical protein GF335_04465 [Candidatus Moranbacteria bacterium]|nr:hypothetical protein [Candidatus Moranbacteria bacterium]